MLKDSVKQLLNEQVNKEFFSAYLYLDFSDYFENQGLAGFANYFRVQAQEENAHAMIFIKYLQDNGERVSFEAIGKPNHNYTDNLNVLKAALQHEIYVTNSINKIYEEAYNLKDFRTMQFLDWFIEEQGEEENSADTLIRKYELFGSDSKGLYLLDQELGARVYTVPAPLSAE
jgi:ferritin